LIEKLKFLGAVHLSSDWGVAGSQELETMSIQLRGDVVIIEAETYVGLSISGPDVLVDEITRLVAE
jgi:hypothetical protein